MFLFFDTETTGLPKNWKAPMTEINNWPRVIQLAWMIFDEKREVLYQHNYLIKPDKWQVPMEKFWIDNGFSTAQCEEKGLPLQEVLEVFLSNYDTCQYLVSHNMSYDYNVLGAEMLRYKMGTVTRLKRICTKEESTYFCNLPKVYGKPKWPKLSELHLKLFGEGFEDAHDALADVKALARCFFALMDKEVIKL